MFSQRNLLYKGSSPREELEFAKTAIALGKKVDVGALIEALERHLEKQNEELEYWKQEYKAMENEYDELQSQIGEMEGETE